MPEQKLRDMIRAQQKQLLADLEEARSKFDHGGDRGTAGLEAPFRRFLQKHLPRRLAVGQGEVIDSHGTISAQTDVVIFDEDHPFAVDPEEPSLALIEGVSAAGELKTTLTSDGLEKALLNSARFKGLRAEEAEGTLIRSNESDRTRFVDHRPYFLVAAESQLAIETVAKRLHEVDIETDGQIVDAVYLLDRGWIVNFGDGQGAFQFRTPQGVSVQAWVPREIPAEEVLFDFFVWLSAVMPRFQRLGSPYVKYL